MGGGESFEPRIFKNSNGSVVGLDREVADYIESVTGLKIEFELDLWPEVQERVKRGELDGLSSATQTKAREEFYYFTHPYLTFSSIVIVHRDNPQHIYTPKDVISKRAAVQRGSKGLEMYIRSLGDVEMIYYEDVPSVLNAVANKEVDFTVLGGAFYYLADKMGITHVIKDAFVLSSDNHSRFAFAKHKAILVSIFNKALASMGTYQLNDIKNRWFKVANQGDLNLTQKEKEYLYTKKKINTCIDPNWYPYEKNDKGTHVGMSSDFFANFEQKLYTRFNLIPTENWAESLQAVQDGRCDILSLAMKTPERDKYLNFTKPYIDVPVVIATKKQVPFVQGFESLKGKKVAVVEAWALSEIIKKEYPEVDIVPVKNIDEGLKAVADGKAFGYMDALATISYRMQTNKMDNLKVSGSFDLRWELGVGVRKDDPILLSIFQKLIASVSNEQRQEIMNRYIAVNYEGYIDYSMIYKFMAGFAVVLTMLLLWNHRIRQEKIVLDRLYAELKVKEEKLEAAYKELEEISTTDKLTNICNRRKIDMAILSEIERCERNYDTFSLVLFDIDHFKRINDTYGHQIGDTFLSEFAFLVTDNIRAVDIFGRWGGEEFIIISPNSIDESASPYQEAERVRALIEEHSFSVVGHRTASFGVTTYRAGDTMDSMLQRVDDAMYKAKRAGRNCVVAVDVE